MSQQLAYVIITPYSLFKSRTGGILSRLITRTGLELVAVRMFAPSSELVKQYSQAIISQNDPQDRRIQELISTNAKPAKLVEPQAFSADLAPQPVVLPERLMLKSVSFAGKTPFALINQCTLGVGETGKVRLAHTNLTVRCVAIRADSVTVEVVGMGERQELRFERKPGSK